MSRLSAELAEFKSPSTTENNHKQSNYEKKNSKNEQTCYLLTLIINRENNFASNNFGLNLNVKYLCMCSK